MVEKFGMDAQCIAGNHPSKPSSGASMALMYYICKVMWGSRDMAVKSEEECVDSNLCKKCQTPSPVYMVTLANTLKFVC